MTSTIKVTVEPRGSSENIKSRYGAYGVSGKIDIINRGGLSENEKEMVDNSDSFEVGERKDVFPNYLVEEVFKGNYQISGDVLIAKVEAFKDKPEFREENEKVDGLIDFLEKYRGRKVFIRAV